MSYKIVFPNNDSMWDFVEKHLESGYSCNNTNSTVEVNHSLYPQEQTLALAEEFEGKLVDNEKVN